jgi:hypothetical protein
MAIECSYDSDDILIAFNWTHVCYIRAIGAGTTRPHVAVYFDGDRSLTAQMSWDQALQQWHKALGENIVTHGTFPLTSKAGVQP